MSESTTGPEGDLQRKPIEIIHNAEVDIIINNTAEQAAWGQKLAQEFQDGIPEGWEAFDPDYANVLLGEVDGKLFVVKTRTGLGGHPIEDLKTAGPEGITRGYTKAQSYAKHSVTSEIRMAPDIQEVLNGESVQEVVKRLNFKGISYVAPIIAITDRQTGAKSTVYEYIDGVRRIIDRESGIDNMQRHHLLDSLRDELAKAGIQPADFNSRQVLINNEGQLYLIDTEGWTKQEPQLEHAREDETLYPFVDDDWEDD